jgi:hypothetical protein
VRDGRHDERLQRALLGGGPDAGQHQGTRTKKGGEEQRGREQQARGHAEKGQEARQRDAREHG